MDRKAAFENLARHPWFGKYYASLRTPAREIALAFLEKHQGCSHDQFIPLVNRMFMDKLEKPKQWPLILDLLTAASVAHNKASQDGATAR